MTVANARNDPPPSSDRTWAPPNLPNYEQELAGQGVEAGSRVSVNPRKVYNFADLIDIAERNNPETRVAWERARQAAAAVGLSESAYYPFLVASAAAGTIVLSFRSPPWRWIKRNFRVSALYPSRVAVRLSQSPGFTAES